MARNRTPLPPNEDPAQRFAGRQPVSLDPVSDPGALDPDAAAAITSLPDVEDETLNATEQEMQEFAQRLEAERAEQARVKAAQQGLVITDAPPLPAGPPPDAYTAALLAGFQMMADQLQVQNDNITRLISAQEEGKPIPYHKVKPVTPWNPEGKRDRVKLKRPTFLSGYPVNPVMLTETEITLFNQVKPGRYHKREWEVVQHADGSIDIRYPNKSIEQRMMMAAEAPTLTRLLELILTEYQVRQSRRRLVAPVGDEGDDYEDEGGDA